MRLLAQLNDLFEILDYKFKDIQLIVTALTHSSYANETKDEITFNERLEFLGDSVLGLIISDYLYRTFTDLTEGELSKIRAGVVSEFSLAQKARALGLGSFLRLGKGEDNIGGRDRSSVLADAMEAVIGAMYLDGGLNAAKTFVLKLLVPTIMSQLSGEGHQDYKTQLQELLQSHSSLEISYRIIREEGPDHEKWFTAEVCHGGMAIGRGQGRSKKEAEQQAARYALNKLR
ncbi:MAG: ribonuclease III [Caldicoprobacterales bacterium]